MSRVKIGELIDKGLILAHKDGNYGSLYPRTSEFGSNGVPFLTAKLLSDSGQIDLDRAPRLNYLKANKFSFGWIEYEDILLSHNATVGRVALVPKIQEKMLVGTSLTYFRLDRKHILPSYFASFLAGKDFQNQLKSVMSYSTRNQVPITIQRELYVEIPGFSEQQRIGAVYKIFRQKIELNRKTNETLEAMAKALFKSWFVDFDPVRAKAEGRPTGLPAEISDLFPDSFENSELGEIPRGWSICSIEDLLILERNSLTPEDAPEEIFSHYSIPAFDNWMLPAKEKGGTIKSSKYIVSEGTFLVSKLNPRTPRVWLPSASSNLKQICSTEFLICRPRFSVGVTFGYLFFKSSDVVQRMGDLASGTSNSHQRVRLADFMSLPVIRCDDRLLAFFNESVSPLLQKLLQIREKNLLLSKCRDILLPKLISGKIRIQDVELLTEGGVS